MARARRQLGDVIGETPDWEPHERPMIPGSPSTPEMPARSRLAFGLTALLLGLTGGLGTALVGANLGHIQGDLGLDVRQGAWLSSIYVMFNISMNLLLIKYRQQFGLTSFTKVFLVVYALAAIGHLITDTYFGALTVRAISGIAGASLGAMAVMYMMQALPARFKLQSLILGLGITQLGGPIAWILSPGLIDIGGWRSLYLLESALALASLAVVQWVRLPPGIRIHAFEWRDAVSFVLLGVGFGLLIAVVSVGRLDWWLDARWVGWALAGGVAFLVAGAVFEHYRANPLIDTRWVFSFGFLNFALSLLLARVLLTEQPFGITGLMQTVGMGADQTRTLYLIILVATVAGALASAFSLLISMKLIVAQLMLSLVLICIGAFMDANATVDVRPSSLYFSQALLGFAAAMFMGSAMILGLGQLMARGLDRVITFAVMFGVTQILGGVAGGSALATFQTFRAQHHAAYLSEGLVASNPQTAQALQMFGGAYATALPDRAAAEAQGLSTLAQQVTQQANILAFNDVFLLIGWGAFLVMGLNLVMIVSMGMKAKNAPKPADGAPAALAF